MNVCWTKLEDENLTYKLADISFENDTHLRRYVRKVFENLLREMAGKLSPGFRARKKQVERALKQQCLSTCRQICGCWKLAEFRDKTCTPADPGRLMKAATSIPTPELNLPKNPGSRAPSLKDKQMAHYLKSVLHAVGGMARHEDVLLLISRQFNILTIRMKPLLSDENQAEPRLETEFLLSPDHELMAKELLTRMTSDMKDVHYWRFVKELPIEQTATNMGKSAGTVFNREKAYRELLIRFFRGGGVQVSPEEAEAVIGLVSRQVVQEKESS
jgi:hypothetical protein